MKNLKEKLITYKKRSKDEKKILKDKTNHSNTARDDIWNPTIFDPPVTKSTKSITSKAKKSITTPHHRHTGKKRQREQIQVYQDVISPIKPLENEFDPQPKKLQFKPISNRKMKVIESSSDDELVSTKASICHIE